MCVHVIRQNVSCAMGNLIFSLHQGGLGLFAACFAANGVVFR